MESSTTQLVVVGAGPGGYAAAFYAADRGMEVTIVEEGENPGGVCLYRGCIPSKALLHVAKIISEAQEAKTFGVTYSKPRIDYARTIAWKDEVVGALTGGLGQLTKQRKINYLRGRGKFTGPNTLDVKTHDGQTKALAFKSAIIATGSHPTIIPAFKIDSDRVLDSTSALDLAEIPKSMLVIGGGYIGLELGTVFATIGTRVSVVEMLPSLLTGADPDLTAVLKKRLDPLFDSIMLETTVSRITAQKNGIKVHLEGKNAPDRDPVFDYVLTSVGRKPNSHDLGLQSTAVKIDEKGFIRTDNSRRTDEPNIYAIGDVAGEPMLAHKASHEGRVAVDTIHGEDVVFEPAAIPAVVFTDPELAWCGLTEAEARAQGRNVEVAKFPWAASGRSKTLARGDGLSKVIIDPKTERILGAGIVGPGAGELIAEMVLAVEMGATVSDLKLTIHPHPTLSETLMEAAEVFFGHSTHIYRPKRR